MKVSTIVLVTITTTVKMSSAPMVLTTSTGADELSMIPGDPLRGRALRCNLRFAPISAAIPVAPFGKEPGTPHSPPGHDADTGLVILAPALCAALVTVLASLAPAAGAGRGHRSRSSRQHSVRRRCRLRRAPGFAPRPAVVSA